MQLKINRLAVRIFSYVLDWINLLLIMFVLRMFVRPWVSIPLHRTISKHTRRQSLILAVRDRKTRHLKMSSE